MFPIFADLTPGKLLIEGKTKQIFELPKQPGACLVQSKDRITAGDGVRAHNLTGKAEISTATTCKVFELLNTVGLKTHYIKRASETAFVSKKCDMIPIEWVTRRVATGSFLKRNIGVKEGYRFNPPKLETFFKVRITNIDVFIHLVTLFIVSLLLHEELRQLLFML